MLACDVLTRIAKDFYVDHDVKKFYSEIGTDATADLYRLMLRLFPPETDPAPSVGFVNPRQTLATFRDNAVHCLVEMGTEDAVRALERLAAERPDIPLLRPALSLAEATMRLKTWSPLTIKEIFALTDRPDTKLISSADDLLQTILDALKTFESILHGAQTPVRGLWDRQGSSQRYRPIEENAFSDAIVHYLQQKLEAKGIFANREVEVKHNPGAPIGQRVDILVNAVRRAADGRAIDSLSAVIEVKGCWNPELFTALDSQLVCNYMAALRSPVGIYLVGWFDQTHWDPDDDRRKRVPRKSIEEVQGCLEKQAKAASKEGALVHAVVLDIQAPGT